MISISTAEQEAFQGSSPKELILNFPIGRTLTNENIFMESASLEQSICDESNLTFGMVYSSCFSVRIFDDGRSYNGLRVFPQISVTTEEEDTYTRDLGQFVVKSDKLTSDKIYRDLKCYDALANVLSFNYAQWHNQRGSSFTVKQYRDAFFSYVGITQETVALPNDSVTLTKFTVDKISGSQILSAILQLNGAFGYIGYDGKFKYVFAKTTPDYTIEDSSFIQGSFVYEDEPIKKISGVTIKGYSDDYGTEATKTVNDVTAGNSNYSMLTIEDNYLVHACNQSTRQTLCNNLYNQVKDFEYYPSSVQFPVYVGLELGDVFKIVTERKTVIFPVLKRTLSGISALKDSFEAKGESEITSNANSVNSGVDSAQMAINQIRLSVSELLANKVSAEQLDVVDGRIENLETNYVVVNSTLTAHQADIEDLFADKANVIDLNASNARIAVLEGGYAHISELDADLGNVKTLLSGNAGIGDLQNIHLTSENAVVDAAVIRNLVSQYISVNDLLAGSISTDKFTITSDDGSVRIAGNAQTFKDSNGNTRIQMGQDAQGNFTFVLYDASGQGVLIDATGIKESAIADGLITDSKVATNAAIKGSKLDIDSVVSELNKEGTAVLKSNKIWFDESNQNLTQMYSQMSTQITLASSNASSAVTTAQNANTIANTANENAQKAIKALEDVATLDNMTAVLTNDSHVIHTLSDGSGGSYYGAETTINVYKGDVDISDASSIHVEVERNVTGVWDATTRTYTVTNLSADDGYVDFSITYGSTSGYLISPDEYRFVMPNGDVIKINQGTYSVKKRFSLSKSRDGDAGRNYRLYAYPSILTRVSNGTLSPASITYSSMVGDGETVSEYLGKYSIDESVDGNTWVQKYITTIPESSRIYYPTETAKFVRCTLMDTDDAQLDSQMTVIIADTSELSSELASAKTAIQQVTNRVGTVESGINGLRTDLSTTTTELHGLSDGTLLFQTPYSTDGNMVTFSAVVYKAGVDVHTDYPAESFTWYRKTEEGNDYLGYGYRMQVDKTTLGYGGSIVAVFVT